MCPYRVLAIAPVALVMVFVTIPTVLLMVHRGMDPRVRVLATGSTLMLWC